MTFFQPKLKKAIFILSLDTELAWGTRGDKNYLLHYLKTREVIKSLLDLFYKYNIQATWAIVGHLFLNKCQKENGEKHPDIKIGKNIHHFDIDPCTNSLINPEWYGKDIVEMIQNSKIKQEIGCHTFSHTVVGEGCDAEFFDSELKKCRQLAKEKELKLDSFVFPKNRVGFLKELKKNEFLCFRGIDENWYRFFSGKIKKIAHVIDNYLAVAAPAVLPSKKEGLWEIPGSYFYVHRYGWAKFLPIGFRVWKVKVGIKKAMKEKKIFHLWFHPFNIASDPEALLLGLEEIFSFVNEKKQQGVLEKMTMGQAVKYFDSI